MDWWVVLLRQKDDGCDYTIGCGLRAIRVQANDAKGAIMAAIFGDYDHEAGWGGALSSPLGRVRDGFDPFDDQELAEVVVIPGSVLDRETWPEVKAQLAAERAEVDERCRRASEEAEFERLKRKLGK